MRCRLGGSASRCPDVTELEVSSPVGGNILYRDLLRIITNSFKEAICLNRGELKVVPTLPSGVQEIYIPRSWKRTDTAVTRGVGRIKVYHNMSTNLRSTYLGMYVAIGN